MIIDCGRRFPKKLLFLIFASGISLQTDQSFGKTGDISFSLQAVGALTSIPLPSRANQGLGLMGSLGYRVDDVYGIGLSGGMVEFIAPTGQEDMKTAWVDWMNWFYPLPKMAWGEPYVSIGFGVSPYVKGLFEDYWPDYARTQMGRTSPPDSIFWDLQGGVGCLFGLDKGLALDLGFNYDIFFPPTPDPLQTFAIHSGLVWHFPLGPK